MVWLFSQEMSGNPDGVWKSCTAEMSIGLDLDWTGSGL